MCGVHRRTSLMSSFLPLQQYPACLVCLTLIVFVMGGRWPHIYCFVGCCPRTYLVLITYLYIWFIGLEGKEFANSPGDLGSIPGRVIPKTFKMVLPYLTLINIRYVSRVKWSNPEKGVMPFPTHQCSSYWKGSLLAALDYGRQLYLLFFFYLHKFKCF